MKFKSPNGWTSAASVILICATVLSYWPALRAGFIWDDGRFLTDNPLIKAADGLRRFWLTTEAPDYWPVTSTSLWLEWRLWGDHAAGYHATNLALHIGESLLLWSLLRRLAIPGAFLAALLFAVHPVNVESVAWITERKNLLAMLFYLLAILFFLDAEDNRLANGGGRMAGAGAWAYGGSLLTFVLAMLSKGSVAVLPVILLGVIAWRRRLEWWDAVRLAPFFAVGGALALVNVWFQGHGWIAATQGASLGERILGAGAVVWFYLYKALAPLSLVFIYPEWHIQAGDPRWWVPGLAAIAVSAVLWRNRHGWGKPWLFAWGYFCVTLVPVMGFTGIGFMRFSPVADHYQHLAIIGVLALAAAGWTQWRVSDPSSRLPYVAVAAVVGGCMILTWNECLIYRDTETLYRATLEANPNAWLAHNNLGLLLYETGNTREAKLHFEAALRLNPDCAEAHNNLGMLLADAGQNAEAIVQYEKSLRLEANYAEAHNNLGNAWRKTGKISAAMTEYAEALRINPNIAAAENGLGLVLTAVGKSPEAMGHYQRALRLDPNFALAHRNLGLVLAGERRGPEAIAEFETALRLKPDFPEAHLDLGLALAASGQLPAAVVQLEEAVRLAPDFAEAHDNLGVALAKLGRVPEAIAHLETAVRLKPDYAEAQENLRLLSGSVGKN